MMKTQASDLQKKFDQGVKSSLTNLTSGPQKSWAYWLDKESSIFVSAVKSCFCRAWCGRVKWPIYMLCFVHHNLTQVLVLFIGQWTFVFPIQLCSWICIYCKACTAKFAIMVIICLRVAMWIFWLVVRDLKCYHFYERA